MIYINISFIIVGFFAGICLLYSFPVIKNINAEKIYPISIIIPCRNEEKNIDALLASLNAQSYPIKEIICVDDQSEDNTKEIIKKHNAIYVNITDKPYDWNGKSWALSEGARASSADILLFLDADVKLNENAISTIAAYYEKYGALSIQPYHYTKKIYESLALFFNIILVAGTGITFIKPFIKGMFGPVFMIDRKTYLKYEGHSAVKNSILDDYELGKFYHKNNIKYSLFLGNSDIAFRMYADGIKAQWQGFTKNFASGASQASYKTTLMTALYITSLFSICILLFKSFISMDYSLIVFSAVAYVVAFLHIYYCARKLGRFNIVLIALYPLPLLWFTLVFLSSLIKKYVFKKVKWKGRNIDI